LVERFFNKIKHCRRVATRYDKLAANYLAFVQLASIRLWLRAQMYGKCCAIAAESSTSLGKAVIGYLEFVAGLSELIDVGAPFIRTSINSRMAIRAGCLPFLLEAMDRFHELHSVLSVRASHGQSNHVAELAGGGH
jgi:hypothetical protein